MEACFPTQVLLIDVGSQTDQISHHHMVIPLSRQVESSLWKKEHHKKKKKNTQYVLVRMMNQYCCSALLLVATYHIFVFCFSYFVLSYLPLSIFSVQLLHRSHPFGYDIHRGPFALLNKPMNQPKNACRSTLALFFLLHHNLIFMSSGYWQMPRPHPTLPTDYCTTITPNHKLSYTK